MHKRSDKTFVDVNKQWLTNTLDGVKVRFFCATPWSVHRRVLFPFARLKSNFLFVYFYSESKSHPIGIFKLRWLDFIVTQTHIPTMKLNSLDFHKEWPKIALVKNLRVATNLRRWNHKYHNGLGAHWVLTHNVKSHRNQFVYFTSL